MTESEMQVYESSTLALPALKMVLVHARNEAQNKALPAVSAAVEFAETTQGAAPVDKETAVRRIIEHLQALEE